MAPLKMPPPPPRLKKLPLPPFNLPPPPPLFNGAEREQAAKHAPAEAPLKMPPPFNLPTPRALFKGVQREQAAEHAPADVTGIPLLSGIANSVVFRCSRILILSTEELQRNFETDFADHAEHPAIYARQLLEFCCYRAFGEVTKRADYLADKGFSRLMYDTMLAWECPIAMDESEPSVRRLEETTPSTLPEDEDEDEDEESVSSTNPTCVPVQVDNKSTVGLSSFAQIAPSCPIVSDAITVHNLFDALTSSSGGQLRFSVYRKYLKSLNKMLKSAKNAMEGPLVSALCLADGEIILAIAGDVPIQPVLQHNGGSARPGRLTLTTHALYFELSRPASYDKAVKYDLSIEMNQVVKHGSAGPLGALIVDNAVMFKSASLSEPIYFEFPVLKGNSRRDKWLGMIREVLLVHRFIRTYGLKEVQGAEAISEAILAIFRCCSVREAFRHPISLDFKSILTFNLVDKLPKGDTILGALSNYLQLIDSGLSNYNSKSLSEEQLQTRVLPYSLNTLATMGIIVWRREYRTDIDMTVSVAYFGQTKSLQLAVEETFCDSETIGAARETVDQVKVEGIETHLALIQELMLPLIESGRTMSLLTKWENPSKSTLFLILILFFVFSGLFRYIIPSVLLFFTARMLYHKFNSNGKPLEALKIKTPPGKKPLEKIRSLQDGIGRLEGSLKAGNIALLKIRAIYFAVVPETSERVALVLAAVAAIFTIVPIKYVMLLLFLAVYTHDMPMRRESNEKMERRLGEWWARIPAAPVDVIRPNESKKTR